MTSLRTAGRLLLLLLFLTACAGELNTPGEALRLLGSSLGDAFIGEPYEESLRAAGGLRPYSFEIASGSLPPGLALEAGIVRGVPTETGTFTFMISVSDGNLSSTVQEYRLRVTELPPVSLELTIPDTEMRNAFTVRVGVQEARDLAGFSTRLRWDPQKFRYVEGSLSGSHESWALFADNGDGWLQADVAWLSSTYSGGRQVFTFRLEPLEPARPGLAAATVFARSGADGLSFYEQSAGARLPAVRPTTPAPAVPDEPAETPQPEGNDEP